MDNSARYLLFVLHNNYETMASPYVNYDAELPSPFPGS